MADGYFFQALYMRFVVAQIVKIQVVSGVDRQPCGQCWPKCFAMPATQPV